jgi:hypothetical protein
MLYLFPSLLPNYSLCTFISRNFVFFTLGIVFSIFSESFSLASKVALLSASFSFLITQYLYHVAFGLHYSDQGLGSLVLAIISIIFIVVVAQWLKPNRYLLTLGSASLVIYLLHILAGSGARVILSRVFEVSSFSVHMVIGCFIGLLVPILVLMVVNKVKIPYVFSAPISRLNLVKLRSRNNF